VNTTVNKISDPVHEKVLNLQDGGDIEADLCDLARRQLTSVMRPRLLEIRRLVMSAPIGTMSLLCARLVIRLIGPPSAVTRRPPAANATDASGSSHRAGVGLSRSLVSLV
jgi:hypothetical protein